MWQVEFYQRANGEKPAETFILNLNVKMQAKAIREMELLEEKGNTLRSPHSEYIGDGIFELRVKFSSNICRFFYFFFVDQRIIITNGFIKKKQKTPKGEIEKACKYKKDFLERHQ